MAFKYTPKKLQAVRKVIEKEHPFVYDGTKASDRERLSYEDYLKAILSMEEDQFHHMVLSMSLRQACRIAAYLPGNIYGLKTDRLYDILKEKSHSIALWEAFVGQWENYYMDAECTYMLSSFLMSEEYLQHVIDKKGFRIGDFVISLQNGSIVEDLHALAGREKTKPLTKRKLENWLRDRSIRKESALYQDILRYHQGKENGK